MVIVDGSCGCGVVEGWCGGGDTAFATVLTQKIENLSHLV